jgi:hypothetical protein
LTKVKKVQEYDISNRSTKAMKVVEREHLHGRIRIIQIAVW